MPPLAKLEPETESVKPGSPAIAKFGLMLEIVGPLKVKVSVPDMTGPGSLTLIEAEPGDEMDDAGTEAVSCDDDIKLVVNAVPFQLTVAPETKPDPFTVRVNDEPPASVDAGLKLLTVG